MEQSWLDFSAMSSYLADMKYGNLSPCWPSVGFSARSSYNGFALFKNGPTSKHNISEGLISFPTWSLQFRELPILKRRRSRQ